MTPEEHRRKNMLWVEHLRSMINPQYAEQEGTESHERAERLLIDTIRCLPGYSSCGYLR